jgi:hypothetical protein
VISPHAHPRLREFAQAVRYSPTGVLTIDVDRVVRSHNRSSSYTTHYVIQGQDVTRRYEREQRLQYMVDQGGRGALAKALNRGQRPALKARDPADEFLSRNRLAEIVTLGAVAAEACEPLQRRTVLDAFRDHL